MSQMLYPLFGAYASDSLFALMVPGPAGVYEGMDPSLSGAGGSAGWTVSLGAGAWKTQGDPAGVSLANALGRFLIREDAPITQHVAGPGALDRIDLVVGIYLYSAGPINTAATPPTPTGQYTAPQMAGYGTVSGTPSLTPVAPAVLDPYFPDGHRAVVLAQVYVPATGQPTATIYAPNKMRFERMAAATAEVIAARTDTTGKAWPSLQARVNNIQLTPGAQGIPGKAATLALGNVTTGVVGSPAVVTLRGTPQAAIMDIALPQGPAGTPGTNGAPGANGTNGTNGINGTNGTSIPGPAGQDASAPPGAVIAYAGAATPAGYLLCDGSSASRTAYAALFAAVGTIYGTGDGVTTFNVPDMRGMFPMGANLANAEGSKGGEASHTLTASEMPNHTHAVANYAGIDNTNLRINSGTVAGQSGSATGGAGGGLPHNNIPPFLAMNFIIKT